MCCHGVPVSENMRKYKNSITSEMKLKNLDIERDISTAKVNEQLRAENSKHVLEIGIQTELGEIVVTFCNCDLEIKVLQKTIYDLKSQFWSYVKIYAQDRSYGTETSLTIIPTMLQTRTQWLKLVVHERLANIAHGIIKM